MSTATVAVTLAAIGATQAALRAEHLTYYLSTLEKARRYQGLQQLMASPPYP
ncbi:hypothetical protein [Microvirga sp. G4-2]|uniref:hypothetical protein n=1 Tax=Microvirga sp. G4-2 TaxID=3434467 RepID=UPI004043FE8A